MEITKLEIDTILRRIKQCCQDNNCVRCPFSLKDPDYQYGYETSYRCLAKVNGVDPWQWELDINDDINITDGDVK